MNGRYCWGLRRLSSTGDRVAAVAAVAAGTDVLDWGGQLEVVASPCPMVDLSFLRGQLEVQVVMVMSANAWRMKTRLEGPDLELRRAFIDTGLL
ncbi:hypothetical protein E4U57_005895 [Claviceps arundinis]|uniref:Polyketide synthase n=1 Tax=Claviceps arundinis TaxID=1623583 RepID=A0ABQ7P325_9HYPO|nr:hypothetical protein E4U57_005895 [Claviceps arundinis]